MNIDKRQHWAPIIALLWALAGCGSGRGNVVFSRLGRDYYVNNRQAACRDSGTGTEAEPFCTFRPINDTSSAAGFGPGDRILLARGATWNEPLVVKAAGKGSPDRLSMIGAYGEGARPRIILHGLFSEKCLLVIDPDHWEIRDLELGHAGAGLVVHYTTVGKEGLRIENIYAHHHAGVLWSWNAANLIENSAGIALTAHVQSNADASPYVLKGLTLRSIEGAHNTLSIMLAPARLLGVSSDYVYSHYNWQDIVMQDLELHDDDAGAAAGEVLDCHPYGVPSEGPSAGRSVKGCCPGSMLLGSSLATTIIDTTIRRAGACFTGTGTAAIATALVKDFTIVNSIIRDTPDTGSGDQTGIDFEHLMKEVRVRNTFLASNTGSAIELYSAYPGDYSTDSQISGNVFIHNGVDPIWLMPQPVGALFRLNILDLPATGRIDNNLFAEPSGIVSSAELINPTGQYPPAWSGYRFENNFTVADASEISHAAADYADTQGPRWFYLYRESNDWKRMSFEAESQTWTAPTRSARIGRFIQVSGEQDTARVWKAPADGAVTIRGRAIQIDRSCKEAIRARIIRASSPRSDQVAALWPSGAAWEALRAEDLVGTETNADHVPGAGDELRFEVAKNVSSDRGAHCEISWVPAVAYTMRYAHRWRFESPGRAGTTKGFEGWRPLSGLELSVGDGMLRLDVNGPVPAVLSPEKLAFAGSRYRQVEVRTVTDSAAAIPARLYFITAADGAWNEQKSKPFTIAPERVEVALDMASSAEWTSATIDRFAIQLEAPVGTRVGIDAAAVGQPREPAD